MSMARLLAALLAAAALLAVGQLSHAASSTAEEFWRTVLPDSPIPDAILRLFHPDTNSVSEAKRVEAEGLSSMSSDDNQYTNKLSKRYFYGGQGKQSSSTHPDEYEAGKLSRIYFYSSQGKQSSSTHPGEYEAGEISKRYFYGGQGKQSSSTHPSEYKAGKLSKRYFYGGQGKQSSSTHPNEYEAGKISKRYFYGGQDKQSSSTPPNHHGAGKLSKRYFYGGQGKQSSLTHLGEYYGGQDKHSSSMPPDNHGAGELSKRYFYDGQGKKSSSTHSSEYEAGKLSKRYFYDGQYKQSSSTHPVEYEAGKLSKRYFYGGQDKQSSSKLPGDDNTGDGKLNMTWFFHEKAMHVGNSFPFYFPAAPSTRLGLLPCRVADSIPFSSSSLPSILTHLSIAGDSIEVSEIEDTLNMCETPPLVGESPFCATSLEALVEGAMAGLRTSDIRPMTSDLPHSGAPLQQYTIRAVRSVYGSGFVSCHDLEYPYTVYMCHGTGPTRAYTMEMEGARGNVVAVVTVCHTDTSHWNPEHDSFKVLGTKPGGAPVCHFLPYGHILWAKKEKPLIGLIEIRAP